MLIPILLSRCSINLLGQALLKLRQLSKSIRVNPCYKSALVFPSSIYLLACMALVITTASLVANAARVDYTLS
jgi:hypothetical protein